ncbi:MAG: glycine cleavage system protein R [Gammaproteobacteria bacterium]|nr:MAG: glycine cleavage system protein R [Gammaproteobacteria bacterium]RLA51084.1 MAG: glycine cleavage system protein R [Gammaproteobacteria bacterium]
MNHLLALTVITNDRPGVVELLAATITQNHGNWLESSMSHLAGKFAGILLVSVADHDRDALMDALEALAASGLRITIENAALSMEESKDHTCSKHSSKTPSGQKVGISVTSNDRPGIVGEITKILANQSVNVEELSTYCDNAAMSGEALFHLRASLDLPVNLGPEDLQLSLEGLSDDLIVEFDPPGSN